MRKICDLNNSGASADFRCKKAHNHGDCGDLVKVFYLPSNSAKFIFWHLTRNQLYLRVPWVRIPNSPPKAVYGWFLDENKEKERRRSSAVLCRKQPSRHYRPVGAPIGAERNRTKETAGQKIQREQRPFLPHRLRRLRGVFWRKSMAFHQQIPNGNLAVQWEVSKKG